MQTRYFTDNTRIKIQDSTTETSESCQFDTIIGVTQSQYQNDSAEHNIATQQFKGTKSIAFESREKPDRLELSSKTFNNQNITQNIVLFKQTDIFEKFSVQKTKLAVQVSDSDQDEGSYHNKNSNKEINLLDPSNFSHMTVRDQMINSKLVMNDFKSVQNLDLIRNSLGLKAIEVLCSNGIFKSLKSLNLSENPLGSFGIKFITDNSNWIELQALILDDTLIDCEGAKYLAMNESWVSLQALSLDHNPLLGDLGAFYLSLNRKWAQIKSISFRGCNLCPLGYKLLQQNKNFNAFFEKKTTNEAEDEEIDHQNNQHRGLRRKLFPYRNRLFMSNDIRKHNKWLQIYSTTTLGKKPLTDLEGYLRGGFSENNSSNAVYLELIAKFNTYRQKILKDLELEKEGKLYIDVRAKSDSIDYDKNSNDTNDNDNNIGEGHKNSNDKTFELASDIKKYFLNNEIGTTSKVLLLTGEAGIGKSLFCKHFQKQILSDWSDFPDQTLDGERNWFPIYIRLLNLKKPKPDAISEILAKELSLSEEEILMLQKSESCSLPLLPHLFFIFDGYDQIQEDIYHSLNHPKDYVNNNFCMTNKIGTEWKNVKVLVTCREENLQGIKRRDLLFAPLNGEELTEPSPIRGSFLQRKIEPFSDEQITCYLKKYCFYKQIDMIGEIEIQPSTSWNVVKIFENIIDKHELREMARVPFMLWIICDVLLPSIAGKIVVHGGKNPVQSKPLSRRFLLDSFIKKQIEAVAQSKIAISQKLKYEGEESKQYDHLVKAIKHQLQNLALIRSSYYSEKIPTTITKETYDGRLLLELSPLIQYEDSSFGVGFRHSLVQEFFLAKKIGEEIIELATSLQEKSENLPKEFHLNQRFLVWGTSCSPIILFLCDALRDKRVTTDQLVTVVRLTKFTKQSQKNEIEKNKIDIHSNLTTRSSFAIAAANAITILNALGYDFSNQDFSYTDITGANLSYGIFEGTNFKNAVLKEVCFTGAWLKDATFARSNMEDIELGEIIANLKIEDQAISSISYSSNGKHIAVDTGDEVVIFEYFDGKKFQIKEMRRFPGYLSSSISYPFSLDGKQIVTVAENRILHQKGVSKGTKPSKKKVSKEKFIYFFIWDIESGKNLKEIKVPMEGRKIINFSSDRNEAIMINDDKIQKYNILSGMLTDFSAGLWGETTNYDFISNYEGILLVGDDSNRNILYNLITGKSILKQRQKTTHCKFSPDAKQIISVKKNKIICISDCIRGHMIKSLQHNNAIYSCSFDYDRKMIISETENSLCIQNVADGISNNLTLFKTQIQSNTLNYSLHPDGNQIVVLEDKNTLSFNKVASKNKSEQIIPVRGANNKGLNIKGAIINSSVGLSEQSVQIFKLKEDYNQFDEKIIRKLFPKNSKDAEKIEEVAVVAGMLTAIHAKIIGNDLYWVNLKRLNLSNNNIGDEGGEIIGNNQTWVNLEELVLSDTKIGDKTVISLGINKFWNNLKKLELGLNRISDDGAEAIGNNKTWLNLEELDLHQNEVGDKGAIFIGTNDIWKSMKNLDLSLNLIGNEGAKVFGFNKIWINLEKFFLNSNKVSDKNVLMVLSCNKTWKNLEVLKLDFNLTEFEKDETLRMIKGIVSKSLKILTINKEQVFDQDFIGYLKYSLPKTVAEIELTDRGYGDYHAMILGSIQTWKNLKRIDLSKNKINYEGADHLSKNKTWTNLQTLNLSFNSIGAEGAEHLSKNTSWFNLQTLDLQSNSIGDKGAEHLSKNTIWTNLQTFNLRVEVEMSDFQSKVNSPNTDENE